MLEIVQFTLNLLDVVEDKNVLVLNVLDYVEELFFRDTYIERVFVLLNELSKFLFFLKFLSDEKCSVILLLLSLH